MNKELGTSIIRWLDKNLPEITQTALLTAGMVKWGGRFKSDTKVPVGVAVVYRGKVFLAVADKQDSPPKENGTGFTFLADTKGAKVNEQPFDFKSITLPANMHSREGVISSRIAQFAVNKLTAKIQASSMEGVYKWKGLFMSGETYAEKDLVVYAGGVFRATTGKGAPNSRGGWEKVI